MFLIKTRKISMIKKLKNLKIFLKKILTFNLFEFYAFQFIKQKYFKGNGLEIGPGDFPYVKKNVTYIDKFPEYYNLNMSNKVIKADADNIPFDDYYFNFLISAHCLEHCPDVIKTLKEWVRVVKKGGFIILILPHCNRTFDRGREITSLEHHISDYKNQVDIYDENPLYEWEKISLKNAKPLWLNEKKAKLDNGSLNFKWMAENGLIHYHSWTQNELINLGKYLDLKVKYCSEFFPTRKDSFIVIFEK